MNKSHTDFVHGFLAVGSAIAGTAVSVLPSVEAWLRVTSLLVGIGVGLLSGWSIWRRRNK